jgi:hypothetical protein
LWFGCVQIAYMDHLDIPKDCGTHQICDDLPRVCNVSKEDFEFVMRVDFVLVFLSFINALHLITFSIWNVSFGLLHRIQLLQVQPSILWLMKCMFIASQHPWMIGCTHRVPAVKMHRRAFSDWYNTAAASSSVYCNRYLSMLRYILIHVL